MGCCKSNNLNKQEDYLKTIKHLVKHDRVRKLKIVLSIYMSSDKGKLNINSFLLQLDNMTYFSIPSYSILCNSLKVFKWLIKSYDLCLATLESQLSKYHLCPLTIMCSKGYSEFLQYYLPIAPLSSSLYSQIKPENFTLTFSDDSNHSHSYYSPIQQACLNSHISCIQVIQNHYKNSEPPWWLDLNHTEFYTGENCALLACKTGDFAMIKYLFTRTNSNFHIKNARNESALQVFLAGCKGEYCDSYLEIFAYLVEYVGVDVGHEIEETLIICRFDEIFKYLEKVGKEIGVSVRRGNEDEDELGRYGERSEESCCKVTCVDRSRPSSISDVAESGLFFTFPLSSPERI